MATAERTVYTEPVLILNELLVAPDGSQWTPAYYAPHDNPPFEMVEECPKCDAPWRDENATDAYGCVACGTSFDDLEDILRPHCKRCRAPVYKDGYECETDPDEVYCDGCTEVVNMDGVPWQNDLEECAVHDGKAQFRRAIVYRERGDLLRRDTEGYERFWTPVRVSDPSQVHCCVCGDEVEFGYVTLEAATYEGPLPTLHVNNYCVVFLVDGPVVRKVTRKGRKGVR